MIIKVLLISCFESDPEPESESTRSPESEQPHYDSAPLHVTVRRGTPHFTETCLTVMPDLAAARRQGDV